MTLLVNPTPLEIVIEGKIVDTIPKGVMVAKEDYLKTDDTIMFSLWNTDDCVGYVIYKLSCILMVNGQFHV